KNLFINTVADQLNSCFSSAFVQQKVNEFNARLASSRTEHYNRWRSGTDTGTSIHTFAINRPGFVLHYTNEQFELPGTALLTVNRIGNGGKVTVNTITIDGTIAG